MIETEKGYMSDDGVEFTSYLEYQTHDEYVKRGLTSYGHDPNQRYGGSGFYFNDTYDPLERLYRR